MYAIYKVKHSYKVKDSQSNTLSLNEGEQVCILEKTNDSWWLASDIRGKVGFVPISYLRSNSEQSSNDVVLQSVDRAIESVYKTSGGNEFTPKQHNILEKLLKHRESIVDSIDSQLRRKSSDKRQAPQPPTPTITHHKDVAPPPPVRSASTKSKSSCEPCSIPEQSQHEPNSSICKLTEETAIGNDFSENNAKNHLLKHHVPNELGEQLLSIVATKSGLKDSNSRELISELLSAIGTNISSLSEVMSEIFETIPISQNESDPIIDKLGLALENLCEIKDDAQQRNWAIEDDQEKISAILNDVLEGLAGGDKHKCKDTLSHNHCTPVLTLANYHQMETRIEIKLLNLQVIGAVCTMSDKFVSVFLTSVLPDELVRELTDHISDIQRVCYSALVLSMIFSTGEPVPIAYYDTINEAFLSFLLKNVEEGLDGDVNDQVGDIFVRLMLAINLHYIVPNENPLMNAIVEYKACNTLSEKIMLLINRGDDPVEIRDSNDDDSLCPPNSVLKFVLDIFSRPDTATTFFYTNDLLVLVDIVARNIVDLSAGDKLRTEYLDLLLNIVRRSTYHEIKHRSQEIKSSLERIQTEDLPDHHQQHVIAEFDKTIVETILKEDCFK